MKVVFFSTDIVEGWKPYELQIVNIAALHDIFAELTFNVYVKPTCEIKSFRNSGFEMVDGEMYRFSKKVKAKEARNAMNKFILYLKTIDEKILLVSYGCFFDARRVVKMAADTGLLEEFREVVAGFADMRLIYDSKGFKERNHLPYFAEDQFEYGCTEDETNTAYRRVVLFQKLIQHGYSSRLTFEELRDSSKTVDKILKETLKVEEFIAHEPKCFLPSGYYRRF